MKCQWKGLDQGSLEHGKEICSSFKSNEVIKIKSNRKSRNKSEKFSKKESSEIRDVTITRSLPMNYGRRKERHSQTCVLGAVWRKSMCRSPKSVSLDQRPWTVFFWATLRTTLDIDF